MLRSMPQTYLTDSRYRVARIAARIALFTGLTIIAARMQVELGGPVPFTFQPLAVLLAGMVLGAREGMASQLAYVGLIALGMPVDARGLGAAAFFGPTGGYRVPLRQYSPGVLPQLLGIPNYERHSDIFRELHADG